MSRAVPELRFPEFAGIWEPRTIGDIAQISKGKGISKADIAPDGLTPCIRYGELYTTYGTVIENVVSCTNVDANGLRLSKGGEIIIPASGETSEDIATAAVVVHPGIALGGDLNILTTDHNGHFLAEYISGRKRLALAGLAQGNSVVHLYPAQISSLELGLPSFAEQQRVADFLGTVDAKLDTLQRKKSELKNFKSGLMQSLFSQELRFNREDGTDFPAWEEETLGNLGKVYGGLSGKSAEDFGFGVPFVTYRQIFESSVVDFSKCGMVRIGKGERQNRVLEGDVLVTSSSETPEEVGFTSVVMIDPGEAYLNSFAFGFRSNDRIIPAFSRYLFRSPPYRAAVVQLAQGSTRFNISKAGFLKICLPIPHPDEQRKIADIFSALDTKIASVTDQINHVEAFKKGLLQQMFV